MIPSAECTLEPVEQPSFVLNQFEHRNMTEEWPETGLVLVNARTRWFVAKPGRTQELHRCLCGRMLPFLRRQPGFVGAMVLTSPPEARRLAVFSFWKTENAAAGASWEEAPAIRKMLSTLVDVRSKVEVCEAGFSAASGMGY